MTITRTQLTRIQVQEERRMLNAFNAIIADIRDQAVLSEVVRALEVGNTDSVIRLLGIDEATWSQMGDAIRESYRQGGVTGATQMGRIPVEGGTIRAHFDMQNPAAAAWVAKESSRRIVEIVTEQREIIRSTIAEAVARGQGPRQTALDLVGRIDPRTRQRVGGIVGLTENQAGWVRNARRELETLDPNYLTRELRDKRLDAAVRRAIADGKPLTAEQIDRAVTQMQARALRYRGENIARTESINALREGQAQAISQAIGTSEIDPRDATKMWDASLDSKTRESHARVNGDSVPIDQPFIVGGYQMMHPGDSSMGAPASLVVNCRCSVRYEIDYLGRAARIEGFG